MQACPSVMIPLYFVYPACINWIGDSNLSVQFGVFWTAAFVVCLHLCAMVGVCLVMSAYAPCWLLGIPVVVTNTLSVLISSKFYCFLYYVSFSTFVFTQIHSWPLFFREKMMVQSFHVSVNPFHVLIGRWFRYLCVYIMQFSYLQIWKYFIPSYVFIALRWNLFTSFFNFILSTCVRFFLSSLVDQHMIILLSLSLSILCSLSNSKQFTIGMESR